MSTSGGLRTLASQVSALRKVGQDARAFRKASKGSGAEDDRTPNLGIASAALSQLSYRPERRMAADSHHRAEEALIGRAVLVGV